MGARSVPTLLFGCLACFALTSEVNADGRVFVLDLSNSTGAWGFRDAERACASLHARLASSAELRHAVAECFFSPCTRGWLYGGMVGTTECNVVGSVLKAVDVRTENATEDAEHLDAEHLDAFCIKDKGVPCGDPPSFPNARLQGHSGYEMGDELLYTCVPGYVIPSGHSAFSLLCDSCGEWYGLVEICVKDGTESHIDYEDKFTDSYGEVEHHNKRPEEAHGEVYEEVHGAEYTGGKTNQEHLETSFSLEEGRQVGGELTGRKFKETVEGEKEEERPVEDFIGHPMREQEQREEIPAATDAPVSLLSQKHMFWFPSEAFQEEGHSVSTNPVTQITQRASGIQSEESKENNSQERRPHWNPADADDHESDNYDDHYNDDQDDPDDQHHDNQDDPDSHQDEDDHDDHLTHNIPAQRDDLDSRGHHKNHDDHDDHYDMGEHEEDHSHIRYNSQEYDDRGDTYDEHKGYEDHEDVTDPDDQEHPDGFKEHPDHDDHDDHDDGEKHYDQEEGDDNDDYPDLDDHGDHEPDDHDSYGDHDSKEDVDDGHHHIVFSIARGEQQNGTQKGEGGKDTTDDTWLDGYPVDAVEMEKGDSSTEQLRPEDRERGTVKGAEQLNDVEIHGPVPSTGFPEVPVSPTTEPALQQGEVGGMWPGFIPTASPSPDTLDYDTQQEVPTHSWLDDLTEHPSADHDPAPPVHDGDVLMEHNLHKLPSEMGETICTGENCPPSNSSGRGPKVAAIIVVVCLIVTAVVVGVWCYRRQQQKSSMYEMNQKVQSQTRTSQQIEMQQKV